MVSIPEQADIDNRPLTFGKFKGMTPNQIFEDEQYYYIVWLYENIEDDVVSECLYEEASLESEFFNESADRW